MIYNLCLDYSEEMMAAYIEALGNLSKSSPKKGGGQGNVIRDNFLFSQNTVSVNNDDSPDTKSTIKITY